MVLWEILKLCVINVTPGSLRTRLMCDYLSFFRLKGLKTYIWKLIFRGLWRKPFLQGFDKILDQYLTIAPVGDFVKQGQKGTRTEAAGALPSKSNEPRPVCDICVCGYGCKFTTGQTQEQLVPDRRGSARGNFESVNKTSFVTKRSFKRHSEAAKNPYFRIGWTRTPS